MTKRQLTTGNRAYIIKAVCLIGSTVACVAPTHNDDGAWSLPGEEQHEGEDAIATLERVLHGMHEGELKIGAELCRTDIVLNSTPCRVITYICYPDKMIHHLEDGSVITWLTPTEMANHVWRKMDEKATDRVMSPLFGKSEYRTKKAIQEHALDAIDLTLGEIDSDNTRNSNNKGYPGNVIEQIWFSHQADNISAPDFPEAGVELKVTPIDVKRINGIINFQAGERLVLNIINYRNEQFASFTTSSFWDKNKFLEIIQYLRRDVSNKRKGEDRRKYKVKYANLFALEDINEPDFPNSNLIRLSDKHMAEIEQDWNKIHQFITEGRAAELTESLTRTLGTCTKGNRDYRYTTQSNGEYAKSRAYCFKKGFMTTILHEYILGEEPPQSLIRDAAALGKRSAEDIILDYFRPYEKQTMLEITKHFNISWPNTKVPKNLAYMAIRRMLHLDGSDEGKGTDSDFDKLNVEEFNNGQIRIKTITLFQGKPKEHFKVQGIPDFLELTRQTEWDSSDLYGLLESQRFLLLVFNNENPSKEDTNPAGIRFMGAKFWSVRAEDLHGQIQSVWEEDVSKIREGVRLRYQNGRVYNNFVKPADDRILHLRPDAAKSQYCPPYYEKAAGGRRHLVNNSRQLPAPAHWDNKPDSPAFTNSYMTKQAWWLNMEYMFRQVQDLLM